MLERLRPKIIVVCLIFIAIFLRLAYWQWERYQSKIPYLDRLKSNLSAPIIPFSQLGNLDGQDWENYLFRRVEITGQYDCQHEMVLRNRRFGDVPGVFLLTPIRFNKSNAAVVVQRGFVPLDKSKPSERAEFAVNGPVSITGLIKAGKQPFTFLQPKDPPSGAGFPWVDAWLRVDLPAMAKQLPYPLFPIYIEAIDPEQISKGPLSDQIIRSEETRDDMFNLTERMITMQRIDQTIKYPAPVFDPVIPPTRHLGYVYEWSAMAILTFLFGLALHLKKPRDLKNNTHKVSSSHL